MKWCRDAEIQRCRDEEQVQRCGARCSNVEEQMYRRRCSRDEVVKRFRGGSMQVQCAKVQRCRRDAEVHRRCRVESRTGADEVHRCGGAQVQRCRDDELQRSVVLCIGGCRGAVEGRVEVQRCRNE